MPVYPSNSSTPFDLAGYVTRSFPNVSRSGDELIVTCFFCQGKKKLYINTRKRKFFCYRCGAGRGATLISFIRDHRGVTERTAWEIFRSGEYSGYGIKDYSEYFDAEPAVRPRDSILPTEYVPLYPVNPDDVGLADRAVRYLRGRGLTDGDMLVYQLGYCSTGRYRGRIIIPVIQDEKPVYFMARLFFGFGERYLNPRKDEVLANPADLIFNWDLCQDATVLQLTEGTFDSIAMGQDCGGLFGKQIHDGQMALLQTGSFESVELWLDSIAKDPANARDQELVAFKLRQLGKPLTICRLEWGDPSELRLGAIPVERTPGGLWANYFRVRRSER